MAKVKAFRIGGLQMWFYSGDHRPPHFHARKLGKREVRVFFMERRGQMLELVRPPDASVLAKDRDAIEEQAELHRMELLEEWETTQAG